MENTNHFVIRAAVPTDLNFILSSILKAFGNCRYTQNLSHNVKKDIYYYEMERQLKQKLMKSVVNVASNPQDPSQIYGFIMYEEYNECYIIHMAYIKRVFRNMGFFTELIKPLKDKPLFYTLETDASHRVMSKHNAIYNPFLFFTKE